MEKTASLDGVKLMADAIRKEDEEREKELMKNSTPANVIDATAQFVGKKVETETPTEPTPEPTKTNEPTPEPTDETTNE